MNNEITETTADNPKSIIIVFVRSARPVGGTLGSFPPGASGTAKGGIASSEKLNKTQ